MDKSHTKHAATHDCCGSAQQKHQAKDDHHHDDHVHGDHEHTNPFLIPFLAITVFAIVEFAGGLWTQSLALLSDA